MGGASSGTYFPSSPERLNKLVQQAKEQAEKDLLSSEVNHLLRELLVTFNDRDIDQTTERIMAIEDLLGDEMEIEHFLLGGSVAKHTYVDGLSDIDALLIINRESLEGCPPSSALKDFHKILQARLTMDIVKSVKVGKLAVTVLYRDGSEIQLLPAIRSGQRIWISDSTSEGWIQINPKAFQRILTDANQRLNNSLVPTIKLAKSINSSISEDKKLSGYHIESLAIEVFKGYDGPKTHRNMLMYFIKTAPKHILHPIEDITGQSNYIDDYLGKANSVKRKAVAKILTAVSRKLASATTVDQWRAILEP